MENIHFTNKVVIVTGASSGIGAETAKRFSKYGAKLTLVGRNENRLMNVAQLCQCENHIKPLCLILDLTHPGSCETIIQRTVETYGRLDVLVNCAGAIILSSLFDDSMSIFDELMTINFRVPYHLSQLALPHLIKTKGNIINIGSSISKRFKPGTLPYISSKTALETFTRHAAAELKSEGVRVNIISPGLTRTNIFENFNIESSYWKRVVYETLAQEVPTGNIIEPQEIATWICLAASDVFPNLSGGELLVDGGASMT